MPYLSFVVLLLVAGVWLGHRCAGFHNTQSIPAVRSPTTWALVLHLSFCTLPLTAYFFCYYGDWMLSYGVDTLGLGSVAKAITILSPSTACLVGYAFGGRWKLQVGPLHDRWVPAGVLLALLVFAAGASRTFYVGTIRNFQGEFGLIPLYRSSVSLSMVLLGAIASLAWAQLVGSVRHHVERSI